jgi:hypothetical protein
MSLTGPFGATVSQLPLILARSPPLSSALVRIIRAEPPREPRIQAADGWLLVRPTLLGSAGTDRGRPDPAPTASLTSWKVSAAAASSLLEMRGKPIRDGRPILDRRKRSGYLRLGVK